MSRELPWFKCFPADENRPPLSLCSLAAQAVHHKLKCLAHDSEPYGVLRLAGKPIGWEWLAREVKADPQEFSAALLNLEDNRVLNRGEDGAIMFPDLIAQAQAREFGSRGGNPKLVKRGGDGPPLEHPVEPTDEPQKQEARSKKQEARSETRNQQHAAAGPVYDALIRVGISPKVAQELIREFPDLTPAIVWRIENRAREVAANIPAFIVSAIRDGPESWPKGPQEYFSRLDGGEERRAAPDAG